MKRNGSGVWFSRGWVAQLVLAFVMASPQLLVAQAGDPAGGVQVAAEEGVPEDLRPLLTPAPSELRFVIRFYEADRVTLNGNYAGGRARGWGGFRRRGGEGEVPAEAAAGPVSLSVDRIARLKRFDTEWREALTGVDASLLSDTARADLRALKSTIDNNLAQLDQDAVAMGMVAPLVPFGREIVDLAEARIRIEDIDAMEAGGVVTRITKEIAEIRSRMEAGLENSDAEGIITVAPELARVAAATVEGLHRDLRDWFTFFNQYDPLFTWWVELPYEHVDTALTSYSAFLSDLGAEEGGITRGLGSQEAPVIDPSPPPPFGSVPDLGILISLPHDEMTDIVQRFRGSSGWGGGRNRSSAPERDVEYYRDWLVALTTLDFDALSRDAQIDYLSIKKVAEIQIARDGVTLPENPPRKTDDSGVPGPARGREGLIWDLTDELISYTPEQLIAVGEAEFAIAEEEMIKASREMGFGEDWKAAMEQVKTMHPPPGGQAAVIRDLMNGAVDYLRTNDLLTVPQVASESLHMIMMTPERQLVNPFFTGGAQISVSYPTNTMEYDARLQSMRGNNTPFSHATAFHEMIPGHNFQGYMSSRYGGYGANPGMRTSFWSEGWPLYWELTLYERGFDGTPEERIGALFWRMHRCARIVFSLKFHMGEWSPQEAIDFLVERVNHERDNATAEVLRSFEGGYGPLYQAAYLLGGLQLRALYRELVVSGEMAHKAFNDQIIRRQSMPIALGRLALNGERLTPDTSLDWDFYGRIPAR